MEPHLSGLRHAAHRTQSIPWCLTIWRKHHTWTSCPCRPVSLCFVLVCSHGHCWRYPVSVGKPVPSPSYPLCPVCA